MEVRIESFGFADLLYFAIGPEAGYIKLKCRVNYFNNLVERHFQF
jgi:hypothetical protein